MTKVKFDIKKVVAALTAAGVFACGGAVFADEEVNPELISAPDPVVCEETIAVYNGGSTIVGYKEIDGHKMVPLRFLAESLSYNVTWIDEEQKIVLHRGAQEIGMYIGQDSYYFSKMMPVSVGAAPVLVDDSTTYVPVEFVTEVMGTQIYDGGDDMLTVAQAAFVSVNSVNTDENGITSISVQDESRGEVIVYLSEDTEIVVNGAQGTVDDVKALNEKQNVNIYYGVAMTMSIPPQTTALRIEIGNEFQAEDAAEAVQTVDFSGVITEVGEDYVVIDDNDTERRINIDDEVQIKGTVDKRIYKIDDLTVGSKISGVRGAVETRSIPPQSPAVSIVIESLAE